MRNRFALRAFRSIAALSAAGLVACSLLVDSNGLDRAATQPDGALLPDGGSQQEDRPTSSDGSTLPDGASASKYRGLIMSDNPIGYWRMNTTSGSIIPDETNHRNDLLLQGSGLERGAPGAIAGDPDTSLRITDRSTYAQAQDPRPFDFPNGAPFTVEFWARFDPLDGGDLGLGLLNAKSETGYSTFVHWPDQWGGWSGFQLDYGPDASPTSQNVQGPPYKADAFTYVVATFDGTTLSYYMDGSLKSNVTVSGVLLPRTSPFQIPSYYSGYIDEVAIYDRALTLMQIVRHHDVGTTP